MDKIDFVVNNHCNEPMEVFHDYKKIFTVESGGEKYLSLLSLSEMNKISVDDQNLTPKHPWGVKWTLKRRV